MAFDKSLKLLNYAQVDGIDNNLRLFTELDHSFKVGDKLYIVGGYYDNTQNLSYITSYNSSNPNTFNPFADKIYYTVLDVNNNNNSFVIDYVVNTLTYPYVAKDKPAGTLPNPFTESPSTDPNITVDTPDAYNTYNIASTNESKIHRGVYVSRAIFNSGIFNSGKINNGIFGTDYYTVALSVNLNNIGSVGPDNVYISHFISKNTTITKGQIRSKTFGQSLNTRKFKVIEDSTVTNGPNNPFYIQQESVDSNNNGFGYTRFEKFESIQTNPVSNLLTINDTEIDNNYREQIILDNIIFSNCKIGSNELCYSDIMLLNNNMVFNNCLIQNTVDNNNFTSIVNNSNYDNSYDLDVLNFVFNTSYIEITVGYDTFANNELPQQDDEIYLSNIKHLDEYHILQQPLLFYQDVLPYTYGDYVAGVTFRLAFLDFSSMAGLVGTEADYDFSAVKMYKKHNNIVANTENTEFDYAINNTNFYIKNANIVGGYYENLVLDNTETNTNFGKTIFKNCNQLLLNNLTNNDKNSVYNKCIIDTPNIISGDISNSKIINGFIYQANLIEHVIVEDTVKLHTVDLGNNIFINENISIYNNINITEDSQSGSENGAIYNPPVKNTYMDGRTTPFVIGKLSQNLPIANKAENFDKVKLDAAFYNSQKIIKDNNITNLVSYKLKYEVPIMVTPTDTDLTFALDFANPFIFTDKVINTNRSFITDFGLDMTVDDLSTKITDRTNLNPSGIIDPDFPGVPQPIQNQNDTYEISENYIQENNRYYYKIVDRSKTNSTYDLFNQSHEINNFPSHDQNVGNLDNIIKLKIFVLGGSSYTLNNNDQLVGVVDHDLYLLSFIINGSFLESDGVSTAQLVPACFIEVEKTEITNQNGTIIYNNNQIEPYTQTELATTIAHDGFNQYAIDNIIHYNDLDKDFFIRRDFINTNNNSVSSFNYDGSLTTVKVTYWITWNYGKFTEPTGENIFLNNTWEFSKRTKHTIQFEISD